MGKYGVPNPNQLQSVRDKIRQTNVERYGCESPMQTEVIKAKVRDSLCANGTCPTSKAQISVYEMLVDIYGAENVAINKPFGELSLDCCLCIDGVDIDVEYDGWYWHKDRAEQDRRRNYYLMRRGFKILRIRSNYQLPTKQQLISAIDYLIEGDHHITYIDLDI